MSERIIIRNGTVVTMNDADDVHLRRHRRHRRATGSPTVGRDADVRRARAPTARRSSTPTGKVVMPGLVDLHYHTALGKGWSDHLPLWEYLETCWYPMIRALDPEAAYWAALASYASRSSAASRPSTTCTASSTALGRRRRGDRHPRRAVQRRRRPTSTTSTRSRTTSGAFDAKHGAANGRIEVYVGIEWLPLASEELLRDARALADELGTGIHIHLNESLTEVENSQGAVRPPARPRSPTTAASSAPDCIAAHCVWLSDAEIALMRETGTQISHNPQLERQARQRHRARCPRCSRPGSTSGSVTTPPSATTAATCSR